MGRSSGCASTSDRRGSTRSRTPSTWRPDGSVVAVTGDDVGQFSGADYLTVAYDAATGAQMWARRYAGTVPATEDATDVVFSRDGSDVLVTGYSCADDGITPVYATLAYDATSGAKLWRKRFDD